MSEPVISWSQAKASGLKRYFNGKSCPRGHVAQRMVSSHACVKCNSLRVRKRKVAATSHNKAMQKARYHRWRDNDLEGARAAGRANAANRKARKMAAQGSHSKADIAEIFVAQKGKCAYCRESLTKRRHVDHIIALVCGGSNDRSNLQITCVTCNLSKHRRDPIEFAQSLGRLL